MKIGIVSYFLLFFSLTISAQEIGSEYPKLSDYYLKKIRSHTTDSLLIPLSDTLFIVAEEELNPSRQAMALAYKVDYYYYNKEEQQMSFWVDSAKSFCKEHDVKQYYYFTWQRLVNFYIRKNYLSHAMDETEKMLLEANDENYYAGIVDGEKTLGRILFAKGMYQECKETRLKVVKLMEEAPEGVTITNQHAIYLDLFQVLEKLKEYDLCEMYLLRALKVSRNANQKNNVYGALCDFYLLLEDLPKAKEYLAKALALQSKETNPTIIQSRKMLNASISSREGYHEQAIRYMNSVDTAFCTYRNWLSSFINVYERAGMYKEACYYLAKLDRYIDSVSVAERRIGLEENRQILNMGQLQQESDDLEYRNQRRQFIFFHIAANGLLVAMIIMIVIFIVSAVLRRRLKAADKLNKAFLQHLSHEVRTPLNALVGFTDMIAEVEDDPKLKMDAVKLQKRTNELINMISDTIAKIGLVLILSIIPLSAYGAYSHDVNYYISKLEETQGTKQYLAYCDSLYFASLLAGNTKLQCESMSYKQDYYCNLMLTDSVKVYTDKAKEFAMTVKNPLYYYYYWQHYIDYLISQRSYSAAILETDLMQDEAMESNYYPGIVDAERMKGRLLLSAALYSEAVETYAHTIELAERAPSGVTIANIYQIYLSYARSMIEAGEIDNVLGVMDKALSKCANDAQRSAVYMLFSFYHRKIGELANAQDYLNMAVNIGYGKKNPDEKRDLLKNEILLDIAKGDFKKALAVSDSLEIVGQKAEYATVFIPLYKGLGRYEEAAGWHHIQIDYHDSIAAEGMKGMMDQQMAQLDVNKLRYDNDRKSLAIQKDNAKAIMVISIVMVSLFVIFLLLALKNRRNNKRLKASNMIKTEFLRNLSKEINIPLDDIVNISNEFCTKASKNESLCEYAGTLRECNGQLVKLVHDSMDLTEEYVSGKKEFEHINTCLYLAEDYLDVPVKESVQIQIVPHPDDPFVMLDKHKVVKILANLLHNAAKFTYNGYIVMKAETYSNEVVYTITDTGIGIPKERQEEVFDYFTKVDTMSQGLGLGLPLSRKLAGYIGGTLKLDESYTGGCRFVLRFPLE